jgi:hypothetical protein
MYRIAARPWNSSSGMAKKCSSIWWDWIRRPEVCHTAARCLARSMKCLTWRSVRMAGSHKRAFLKTKWDIQVLRNFRTHFRKDPSCANSFRVWRNKRVETVSVLSGKVVGRAQLKGTSCQANTSYCQGTRRTVCRILHARLCLFP